MSLAHIYARAHHERFKQEFIELLKIPSISTDPHYANEVLRAADWIRAQMLSMGLEVELITLSEGKHPLILGSWNGAGIHAKTVLIYCHYDVQPALKSDGWESEPFEPSEREGKLYARGATDSKVHVMAQLKAVEALLMTRSCPVNIKLVFEGEEESGSETINAFVARFPERLNADIAVISDGVIRSPEQPSLIYGLRGIITMELHVDSPIADLHSGHFGGTVHNPLQALAEIIAQLHDSAGKVTVPHFYDDVATLTAEERVLLAQSDESIAAEWQAVAHAPQQWGEQDFSLHERMGARPTLEINGISGGYTGVGFKTVLPAHAEAKISCRLVPHQNPQTIAHLVMDTIRKMTPPTIKIDFKHVDTGAPAVLLNRHSSAMQAAYRAYEQAWGIVPVWERAGGSVPITYEMLRLTNDVILIGFSYKGGRAHGQNENIVLEMYYKGIETMLYFLQDAAL